MITQQTKSKSLFQLFKERVIVNYGDYFCCMHTFSAKILICYQTFFNLKYIKKVEISYEFDVRLVFTPMCGGRICCFTDCTKPASAAALIHRQQTLYWLFTLTKLSSIAASTEINLLSLIHVLGLDETRSVAYNLGETQTCNNFFLLSCREILESVWQEEENFEVLTQNISK